MDSLVSNIKVELLGEGSFGSFSFTWQAVFYETCRSSTAQRLCPSIELANQTRNDLEGQTDLFLRKSSPKEENQKKNEARTHYSKKKWTYQVAYSNNMTRCLPLPD